MNISNHIFRRGTMNSKSNKMDSELAYVKNLADTLFEILSTRIAECGPINWSRVSSLIDDRNNTGCIEYIKEGRTDTDSVTIYLLHLNELNKLTIHIKANEILAFVATITQKEFITKSIKFEVSTSKYIDNPVWTPAGETLLVF